MAPTYDDAPLVADDNTSFSDYDQSSAVSSTQSLSSSILETTFANGRRYHRKSAGQYLMPTDEIESDRLDMAHHLCLNLFGGELHTAPLKSPIHNVLDCGTGTGIWALDFGEIHPESQVLGVDLAPIQPSWVYPNVRFETDDIEKEWLWKQSFDFIHARMLSVSIRDWPRLASQMFAHTTPGGWVEIVDHPMSHLTCDDDSAPADSAMKTYTDKLAESFKAAGINPYTNAEMFETFLKDAGFVDVQVTVKKMPFGAWPKEKSLKRAGRIMGEIAMTVFEAYGLAALTSTGMSTEEAKKLCDGARDIVKEGKEHWYNVMFAVIGRKPAADEA